MQRPPLWRRLPVVSGLFLTMALAAAAQLPPLQTIELENGLDVVVVENPVVPLATINLAVRTGSFTEPDQFAGLSHLYEHMFFKANAAYPSQEKFMRRVRELGISFNGYTTDEVVSYYFTLPSKNLAEGMAFMADAIRTPSFDQEELTREREVVIGEFDRNEAQPTFVFEYALDSALWMPYVSRKQPLGQRGVILSATTGQMEIIRNLFYVPNNAVLIVSGDVRPDKVVQLARKHFQGWKRGADPFPAYAPPEFPPLRTQLVIREAAIPNVQMRLYFRGPSIGREDSAANAATLLATILNQPTSSLYRALIDSGLALSYDVDYTPVRNGGLLALSLESRPERAREAWEAFKREVRQMRESSYYLKEQVEAAHEMIATRQIFERDNPRSFATWTLPRWWSVASLEDYRERPQRIALLDADDLASFVRRWMVDEPYVVGVAARREVLDRLNFTEEDIR